MTATIRIKSKRQSDEMKNALNKGIQINKNRQKQKHTRQKTHVVQAFLLLNTVSNFMSEKTQSIPTLIPPERSDG